MKSVIITIITALLSIGGVYSQNPLYTKKRIFFSSGFVSPQFFQGTELMNAYNLRKSGLSYFHDETGEHAQVGSYGANTGFSLSIGYYIPIPRLKGMSAGLLVNSGQTGSTPSLSGYSEGYFFNFLNFGGGFQYYPYEHTNLYIKAEAGMGSVFTKNRFINHAGSQDYLHHFGIGIETGGALGYSFTPFKDKTIGLNLEGQYQMYSTRVEVSGFGDDQWRFGALHVSAGLQF